MKEHITYILKHQSGFYVKMYSGDLTLTDNRSQAKEWKPNDKKDEYAWQHLMQKGKYEIIKRTETTTVEYEGVEGIE